MAAQVRVELREPARAPGALGVEPAAEGPRLGSTDRRVALRASTWMSSAVDAASYAAIVLLPASARIGQPMTSASQARNSARSDSLAEAAPCSSRPMASTSRRPSASGTLMGKGAMNCTSARPTRTAFAVLSASARSRKQRSLASGSNARCPKNARKYRKAPGSFASISPTRSTSYDAPSTRSPSAP